MKKQLTINFYRSNPIYSFIYAIYALNRNSFDSVEALKLGYIDSFRNLKDVI